MKNCQKNPRSPLMIQNTNHYRIRTNNIFEYCGRDDVIVKKKIIRNRYWLETKDCDVHVSGNLKAVMPAVSCVNLSMDQVMPVSYHYRVLKITEKSIYKNISHRESFEYQQF